MTLTSTRLPRQASAANRFVAVSTRGALLVPPSPGPRQEKRQESSAPPWPIPSTRARPLAALGGGVKAVRSTLLRLGGPSRADGEGNVNPRACNPQGAANVHPARGGETSGQTSPRGDGGFSRRAAPTARSPPGRADHPVQAATPTAPRRQRAAASDAAGSTRAPRRPRSCAAIAWSRATARSTSSFRTT